MNFLELAKERYSCRGFNGEPVAKADVEKILEAAKVAPTAKNNQPQRIYVLESEEAIEKLKKCTECHYGCKTAFVVCFDANEQWVRSYDGEKSGFVDASIVTTHMMLEAHELGVETTWVMFFNPEMVKKEFALPENIVPAAILVAGYPVEGKGGPSPRHNERKALNETVIRL